jgi:large subunit ribosomal protein L18
MAKSKGKIPRFRRRLESVTNYKKRYSFIKSKIERVVVRKSNRRIIAQIVEYAEHGDRVKAHADSDMLKKYGWPSRSNRPTAYLTGMLLALKAEKGADYILDIGLNRNVKGSVSFAFAKGCIDNGMMLRGDLEIEEKDYNGSRIAAYAAKLGDGALGGYRKEKADPKSLAETFNKVKEEIRKKEK